ncbi:MAG: glycosyltransferase family 9 protein [Kangiellaceae bacterium]
MQYHHSPHIKPKSIFILRLSAIGDVCHTVATVQAIQKQLPAAQITWLIGKTEYALVAHLENIEFILFDKSNGVKEYLKLYSELKNRHFDFLLHMQVSLRASLASLCIKAKERWGFDKARAKDGQWLFTNRRIPAKENCHVADGLMQFAIAVGVCPQSQLSWNFPIPDDSKKWFQQHISADKYVVVSPSASHPNRNWKTESYVQLCDFLCDQGFKVYVTGSNSQREKELADKIISQSHSNLFNLAGETNLTQLAALIKKAEFIVSPDSGPAHIATLVNTKVIGLYAISNPYRTGPYHSISYCISVYEKLLELQTGKKPDQVKWGTRLKGANLMSHILVQDVIHRIKTNILI